MHTRYAHPSAMPLICAPGSIITSATAHTSAKTTFWMKQLRPRKASTMELARAKGATKSGQELGEAR